MSKCSEHLQKLIKTESGIEWSNSNKMMMQRQAIQTFFPIPTFLIESFLVNHRSAQVCFVFVFLKNFILRYLHPHNTFSILLLLFLNLTQNMKYQLSNLDIKLSLGNKDTVNPPKKHSLFDEFSYSFNTQSCLCT